MAIKVKLTKSTVNAATPPLKEGSNPIGAPPTKEELEKKATEKLKAIKEGQAQKALQEHYIEEEQRLQAAKFTALREQEEKKEKQQRTALAIDEQDQRTQQQAQKNKEDAATAAAIKAKEKDIADKTRGVDNLAQQIIKEEAAIKEIEVKREELTHLIAEKEADIARRQTILDSTTLALDSAHQDYEASKSDLNNTINSQAAAWGLTGANLPTEAFSLDKMRLFSSELDAVMQMQRMTIEKYEHRVQQAEANLLIMNERVASIKANHGSPEELMAAEKEQSAAKHFLNNTRVLLELENRNLTKNQQIFSALQTKLKTYTAAENKMNASTMSQSNAQSNLHIARHDHRQATDALGQVNTVLIQKKNNIVQWKAIQQEQIRALAQAKQELNQLKASASKTDRKQPPAMTPANNTEALLFKPVTTPVYNAPKLEPVVNNPNNTTTEPKRRL